MRNTFSISLISLMYALTQVTGHLISKKSLSIIISKPNKMAYDFLKIFQPIVLLNTLGKLIEKVICERLQFQLISTNFIHHNQLEGLKQCLTTNTSIFLMYLIYLGWVKGLQMSALAFYIAEFFPLLNHQPFSLILNKAGFDPRISLSFLII